MGTLLCGRSYCSFAIDNVLFLYAAHIYALCKILLYEGVYAEDGDDGAYDHCIDDGHCRNNIRVVTGTLSYFVPEITVLRLFDKTGMVIDDMRIAQK